MPTRETVEVFLIQSKAILLAIVGFAIGTTIVFSLVWFIYTNVKPLFIIQ